MNMCWAVQCAAVEIMAASEHKKWNSFTISPRGWLSLLISRRSRSQKLPGRAANTHTHMRSGFIKGITILFESDAICELEWLLLSLLLLLLLLLCCGDNL
jgi:hypothetical protein